ncbi:hypothetical protein CC86DRAFT_472984 [Ophiobolus disseminans]|uniref:Uncharacterized protein n=1 Tax=Ophiobolus disseminans TaxID=1469910 RepID=A0A6A6ZBV5_9PLEO|nr:hypothetical protein CC86DRAFT_472984 [Ophiobolus disseminans]
MASSKRERLSQALDCFSPGEVAGDIILKACFSRFFERGTCNECCNLLPEKFRPQEVFTCIQSLRLPNTHVTVQPHESCVATPSDVSKPADATPHAGTPRDDLTPHDTTDLPVVVTAPPKELTPVAAYFEAKYPNLKGTRRQTLTKITQRSLEAVQYGIPHQTSVSKCFTSKDPVALAKKVYQMAYEPLLFRKARLYFLNAVDLAASSATELLVGRNRKDDAFYKISKDLRVKKKDVIEAYNVGSKYLTCMEYGGPASLSYIEGSKSDILRLTDDDIEALCIFRKIERLDAERDFRGRDCIVACEIVSDLVHIGLEPTDIAKGSTRLTKFMGQHVDMESLVRHGKVLPKEHLEVGANSARKRHKTGNEGGCFHIPTFRSDTGTAGGSETLCDGNVGLDDRVRRSGGAPNHQAVVACGINANVASQSVQSSRQTNNFHPSSSRSGQAAISQRRESDEEQEASSGDTDVGHRPQPDITQHDDQIGSTTTLDDARPSVHATEMRQQSSLSYASSSPIEQFLPSLSLNAMTRVTEQCGVSEHNSTGRGAGSNDDKHQAGNSDQFYTGNDSDCNGETTRLREYIGEEDQRDIEAFGKTWHLF